MANPTVSKLYIYILPSKFKTLPLPIPNAVQCSGDIVTKESRAESLTDQWKASYQHSQLKSV